ncbi:hypothetical protein EX30DRAFT_344794 [Ascodesmis nigricans]|uniref:Uncharacterized protein n=1 Tax=Ascodesmis nigricans TaxID=341454 RepID=A0A4V3SHK4_9PEZI|nr:hypothetical protein EX30DRAFT_344794 [Ascodesmis nigricans]
MHNVITEDWDRKHVGIILRDEYFLSTAHPMTLPGIRSFATGDMLSKMHFRTGFDARDVEFVLGGDGWRGVKPFILDFNQMRPWDRTPSEVSKMTLLPAAASVRRTLHNV